MPTSCRHDNDCPLHWFAALVVLAISFLPHSASAKTITAKPGVPVIALTTWYYYDCSTSAGLGSYSINAAPMHGTVAFADVSSPLPGCPAGSPPLPAVQATYTWTDTTYGATTDYFELNYNLNGTVYGPYDINVTLSCPSASDAANGTVIDRKTMPDGTVMVTTAGVARVASRTSADGVSPDNACTPPPPTCSITSETLATVPGQPSSRTTVGVGEWVNLTSNVAVNWAITSGGGTLTQEVAGTNGEKCSAAIAGSPSIQGTQACFTAPYLNDTTVITGTTVSDGTSCTATLTTEQPTGLIFQRLTAPGYRIGTGFPFNDFYTIEMISVAFLTPGNVSFANIGISEEDIPNPYVIPNYNPPLLVTVNNTPAWLVGCDVDRDNNHTGREFSKESYWVYVDPDDNETRFSLVETETHHKRFFDNFYYSKGQIQALSSSGIFVPTPDAAASILSVPWYDFTSPVPIHIDREICEADVENQFPNSVLAEPPSQ